MMIKIEIKDNLKIEVDLSVKDSVQLVNALIKNRDDMEVKLLVTHLSTIVDCYKKAITPIGGTPIYKKTNISPGRGLADLLKDK